jgi:hypothetical protein
MRFVCGPIPASRVLNPQGEHWTPLRGWGAGRLAVAAVLLGLPFLVVAVVLLLGIMKDEVRGLFKDQPLVAGAYLLALLAMVPVHEVIHALAYCQGIRSPHLIVGFWPSRGLCYAIYDSPMPRNRVLGMLVAPFLTLSILPLLFLPWLQGAAWGLVLTYSLLHTAMCGGDLIVFLQLVSQVPRLALVHNNGWQTYWVSSLAEPDAAEVTSNVKGRQG